MTTQRTVRMLRTWRTRGPASKEFANRAEKLIRGGAPFKVAIAYLARTDPQLHTRFLREQSGKSQPTATTSTRPTATVPTRSRARTATATASYSAEERRFMKLKAYQRGDHVTRMHIARQFGFFGHKPPAA